MENDIIPGRMIVTQFKEQLKAKRVFPSIVETNGDATFTFEISSCGFMPRESNPFTPDPHRAVLMVDVCLEKPDGTLIWKNSATAQDHWLWPRLSRVNAFRYNDYIESPKLIRKSFDQAASQIVNQLLKKMEGN